MTREETHVHKQKHTLMTKHALLLMIFLHLPYGPKGPSLGYPVGSQRTLSLSRGRSSGPERAALEDACGSGVMSTDCKMEPPPPPSPIPSQPRSGMKCHRGLAIYFQVLRWLEIPFCPIRVQNCIIGSQSFRTRQTWIAMEATCFYCCL